MSPSRLSLSEALSGQFNRSLSRYHKDSDGLLVTAPTPVRLKEQAARIALIFEQGAPSAPPMQQRINALARLRRNENDLTRRDWNLIAWGLCDDCGQAGIPMEDPPLFDAVMRHTEDWTRYNDVPRKNWFGLLNCYFTYSKRTPHGEENWLRLRKKLLDTLSILLANLKRPKLWSRMLDQHRDILTEEAGLSLRPIVFYGSPIEQEELQNGLPVPDTSWLWHRLIAYQIEHLNELSELQFIESIPAMVGFLRTKPIYADDMLAALLTRYCQSSLRAETHELLKNESFTRWGNPQLRGASRWANVEPPVHAMVLRWFAKEDLEHFFSLLQGAGEVDQARLHYWLRFVDQISYTRILLGADALTNPDPEFRNFRAKNADRCGQLAGGPTHNNAFIMQIQDQYFVEFSGTGNACYAYEEQQLPFNPNARALHSSYDLKKKIYDAHRTVTNTILHNGGWQRKADLFLAYRNIRPGGIGESRTPKVKNYKPKFSPAAPIISSQVTSGQRAYQSNQKGSEARTADDSRINANRYVANPPSASVLRVAKIATELSRIYQVKVLDNLDKGGAFWVLTEQQDSVLGRELAQLGMTFHPSKGFWIK